MRSSLQKLFSDLVFPTALTSSEVGVHLTKYDLKRLELYSRNMADYHLITDLLPIIARFVFLERTQFNLPVIQKVSAKGGTVIGIDTFSNRYLFLKPLLGV